MKIAACFALSFALAGCGILPQPTTPTSLAQGTDQGAWSTKDAEAVRSCLGSGDAKPRYVVEALNDKNAAYQTRVSIFADGEMTPAQTEQLARCL